MQKELARKPQPYVIQAMDIYQGYPSVRVYDAVTFEDVVGRLCTELESSKILQVDLRTLPWTQVQALRNWIPLLRVVHQGVLSVFDYLCKFLPTPEPHELLDTPSEGEKILGWSRIIPNMIRLEETPDGVELYYFTSTSYAERLNGVLYLGETAEPHRVNLEGDSWLCLLEGLAPLAKELVRIAHKIGE